MNLSTLPLARMVLTLLAIGGACGAAALERAHPATRPAPADFDCLPGAACAKFEPFGDPPSTLPSGLPSNFSGYGDPSVRRDPDDGGLWMAYSWLSVHVVSASERPPAVSIHLARSLDGGIHWSFDSELWPATPGVNEGGTLEPGLHDHEVANLLPLPRPGGARWIGARLDYFVPNSGGFARRPASSFRIRVGAADSPRGLGSADFATLGGALTAPGWQVTQSLSSLSAELAGCLFFNEPALHFESPQLYLALRCHAFTPAGEPDAAASAIVLFATQPDDGPARAWHWRYVGRLAAGREAAELGGIGLTQVDWARGRDGRLLLVLTPDAWSAVLGEFVHYGCRVLEVASLEPPQLSRVGRAGGRLAIRAVVTSSDLALLGPGACAYEASSATGLLVLRREMGPGYFNGTLHATGLFP